MPVTPRYSNTFNELLNSRSPRHTSPGTQMLRIQNDPSPIFEHFSTNGRRTIGRPAQAPSNSSAASHTCQLKTLRVSASLRRTDFSPRTQLFRSQRCTLIHSLTYSTRDPGGITRRKPRPQDFKTILIPFSDTSPAYAAQVPSASLRLGAEPKANPPVSFLAPTLRQRPSLTSPPAKPAPPP